MSEEWKFIEGFEGYYMVSNLGRVKSVNREITRSDGKIKNFKEKMLIITKFGNGYSRINLCRDGKAKDYLVHRLVANSFVFNEDPSNKIEVNHKNGDKECNEHSNLEWCTSRENKLHAFRTGLSSQKLGEAHPMSKVSDAQVLEIRELYSTGGFTQMKLAEIFGVGRTTIYEVLNYKTRKL